MVQKVNIKKRINMVQLAVQVVVSFVILLLRAFVFIKIYTLLVLPLNIPNSEKFLELTYIQVAALFMVLGYLKGFKYDPKEETPTFEDFMKKNILGVAFPLLSWFMAFLFNQLFLQ